MSRLAKKIEDQLLAENPEMQARGLRPEIIWVNAAETEGSREALEREIRAINEQDRAMRVGDHLDRAAADLFQE